jgi:hypothetical protein
VDCAPPQPIVLLSALPKLQLQCRNAYSIIQNYSAFLKAIFPINHGQSRHNAYLTPPHQSNSQLPSLPNNSTASEEDIVASGLLDCITEDAIKHKILKMSASTSPGLDGIHIKMLKPLLDTSLPRELCILFQACLRFGQTPKRWNDSLLYPLHKDKAKPYTATNSRPISLICLFRKIFESLILPIVCHSGKMQYSSIQAGFRSGYSGLTNVLALHHLIESRTATHVSFLDFASAFDKVQWYHLKRELEKQNMHPLVLKLIHQLMYSQMTFSVVVNGAVSTQCSRNTGLLQGSPLSPILFSRFINSLLANLNAGQPPHLPTALFFADDGVIMAPTMSKSQELLNLASSWALDHGMSFNIAKCGYLNTGPSSNVSPIHSSYSAINRSRQCHLTNI